MMTGYIFFFLVIIFWITLISIGYKLKNNFSSKFIPFCNKHFKIEYDRKGGLKIELF